MTPQNLLKLWLADLAPDPHTILTANGYALPVTWGKQNAALTFCRPASTVLFAVKLQFGTETAVLGLAKSAECADLPLLAANLKSSPDDLLLAVFEAQNTYFLAALAQAFGNTPSILGIIPPDDPALHNAVPFHAHTTDKHALIASGLLAVSPEQLAKWASFDYLDPLHPEPIPTPDHHAIACLAHFQPEAPNDSLQPGDLFLLPEITSEQKPWPLTLLLDNGLSLAAELTSDQTITPLALLDPSPLQPHDLVIAAGHTTISYQNLVNLLNGTQDTLALTPANLLLDDGNIVASGHLRQLADATAWELE